MTSLRLPAIWQFFKFLVTEQLNYPKISECVPLPKKSGGGVGSLDLYCRSILQRMKIGEPQNIFGNQTGIR